MTNEKKTKETRTVHIGSILRDPRFQVRKKLDRGTIERYAKVYASGNPMPPVEVAKLKDSLLLLEGWHRLAALERNGCKEVDVIVHEVTERDAYWMAAQANLTHGLPLKSGEIREVFRKYIKARKHRNKDGSLQSYREIAQDLGGLRAYTTIRNWMERDFPRIFEEYTNEDEPKPEGGLRDVEPEGSFKDTAKDSLNNTLAAFHALECPKERGEVIDLLEEALHSMKEGGEWEPVEFY